jgi:hypothetical protein
LFGAKDKWLLLRLDDGPEFGQRLDLLRRRAAGNPLEYEFQRAFWRLPLVIGVKDEKEDQLVQMIRDYMREQFARGEPKATNYRGVTIQRYALDADKLRTEFKQMREWGNGQESATTLAQLLSFVPEAEMPEFIYQATVGDGYYLALHEASLKRIIDHETGRKRVVEARPANTALLIDFSGKDSGRAVRQYMEWQTQQRALAGNAMWLPLLRAGVVKPDDGLAKWRAAAMSYYGFEPVSPDGAPFRYDAAGGVVINSRHGSAAKPELHETLMPGSAAERLLERFRSLRTDLRFREDGIHTIVTFERAAR